MTSLPQTGGSYTRTDKGALKQAVKPPKPAERPKPATPPADKKEA